MDRTLNQVYNYANGNAGLAGLRNFFSTVKNFRDRGYSTPKVAEWVNFEILQGPYWYAHSKQTLDLGDPADRDYFYKTFIYGYWSNYFAFMGAQAVPGLALYNGKIVVSFDFFYNSLDANYPGQIVNINDDFFNYLSTRFLADFSYKPYFTCNAGSYYSQRPSANVSTWVRDPRFNKVRESDNFFAPPDNSNIDWGYDINNGYVLAMLPAHVGAYFLQSHRNQGNTYTNGLNKAILARSNANHPAHHLGLSSWNYFPEGSQITESYDETNGGTTNADWGSSDPRQYIVATANFATTWNDLALDNADILAVNAPATMKVGQPSTITVTVRNSGNASWTGSAGYQLYRVNTGDSFYEARENPIDDLADEIPVYRGIFRGRAKTFTMTLTPAAPGTFTLEWQMIHQGVTFFGPVSSGVTVSVQP